MFLCLLVHGARQFWTRQLQLWLGMLLHHSTHHSTSRNLYHSTSRNLYIPTRPVGAKDNISACAVPTDIYCENTVRSDSIPPCFCKLIQTPEVQKPCTQGVEILFKILFKSFNFKISPPGWKHICFGVASEKICYASRTFALRWISGRAKNIIITFKNNSKMCAGRCRTRATFITTRFFPNMGSIGRLKLSCAYHTRPYRKNLPW